MEIDLNATKTCHKHNTDYHNGTQQRANNTHPIKQMPSHTTIVKQLTLITAHSKRQGTNTDWNSCLIFKPLNTTSPLQTLAETNIPNTIHHNTEPPETYHTHTMNTNTITLTSPNTTQAQHYNTHGEPLTCSLRVSSFLRISDSRLLVATAIFTWILSSSCLMASSCPKRTFWA